MVDIEPVSSSGDTAILKELISQHLEHTGSDQAGKILNHWEEILPSFVKVIPVEYRKGGK